jgi:ABC-type dipeptide/oligopeptide/nickel transport system permease component
MRHALRRVLWIVPSVVVVSMFAFWLLTLDRATQTLTAFESEALPLFFNRDPRDVRDRALDAMARIADGRAGTAESELAALGGAALPHVLPRLDTLAPAARVRVALALAPIARRMRIGTDAELTSAERAVPFWSEFWQTRAVDFRPAVVKRLVKRLGQRSSRMRREDIVQLDTFALDELMQAMTPVRTDEDVRRVRRIARLTSEVTRLPWRVPKKASIEDAAATASLWQRWWTTNRSRYVTFDGARRVTAMLTETRYGHWAIEAVRSGLGTSSSGRPVLDEFGKRAPITVWLVIAGALGGPGCGMLLASVGSKIRGSVADWLTSVAAVLLLTVPCATLSAWIAPRTVAANSLWLAAGLMTLLVAATASRYQRARLGAAVEPQLWAATAATGASPWRNARRQLRSANAAVLSLMGAQLPMLVTSAFVVEHGFGLPGLGPATAAAVRTRDDAWLMAMALFMVVFVALLQIASDSLLRLLDVRPLQTGPRRGVP